jgi:hypothetical protein
MTGLNENGRLVWKHKASKILFLEKGYEWLSTVMTIQEDGNNRMSIELNEVEDINFDHWVPMTQEEFDSVERQYKEIYVPMD